MTEQETRQALAVMQAFADGKEIEVARKGENEWKEVTDPQWSWGICKYRVKEIISPYTYAELCEAVNQHGQMIITPTGTITTIVTITQKNVFLPPNYMLPFEGLVNMRWFNDNTPCGVKK